MDLASFFRDLNQQLEISLRQHNATDVACLRLIIVDIGAGFRHEQELKSLIINNVRSSSDDELSVSIKDIVKKYLIQRDHIRSQIEADQGLRYVFMAYFADQLEAAYG